MQDKNMAAARNLICFCFGMITSSNEPCEILYGDRSQTYQQIMYETIFMSPIR
jgi:hypothetical protein